MAAIVIVYSKSEFVVLMETNTEEDPCKVTAEESKTAVESTTFDVTA